MKRLILPMMLVAAPAFAAQPTAQPPAQPTLQPKPVEPGSVICSVEYDPNKAVDVKPYVGDQVVFQFDSEETMEIAYSSDTANIKAQSGSDQNLPRPPDLAVFKVKAESGPQNIVFRGERPGIKHTYVVLLTAQPEPAPTSTQVASNGNVKLPEKKPAADRCLIVRWTYAREKAVQRAAEQRAQWRAVQSRRLEAQLAQPAPAPVHNQAYAIQGDPRLVPQVAK